MPATSSFKNYLCATRALTTYGLPERAALHYSGSLPHTEEGEAVADSLADLGWIISRTVETFALNRAELHALMSLTTDAIGFDPADCADLMLRLDLLDEQRAEDTEPVDPRMLGRLMSQMSSMPEINRLLLYRLLTQAQCSTEANTDASLRAVGLMR